jgi:hypothetical protein
MRHLAGVKPPRQSGQWYGPGFVELSDWSVMHAVHEEDSMPRRGYPPEFRRRVLDLVAAGRPVADVARDLQISAQTIYNWRRQDRITGAWNRGDGLPSRRS